ncbi:MAG: sigma-54 dependent transcriptional regulator [Pseudomonadota bacterium]|nr:sigma-54 dependent transcriptional regulator [Pseudomonadota bacterium]
MNGRPLALIVDDEPDIRELITLTLGHMEIDCHSAADLTQARTLLASHHYDFCLTDMRLPDGDGTELVKEIQQYHPDTPVAMITAHGNMDAAVTALKAGAFDFVSKPVDLQVLRNLINTALKLRNEENTPQERRSRDTLLGESEAMRQIRHKIAKVSRSQAPIYISGESGSGKELVARHIHNKGPRAAQPFIPVNCGAIPESLMESEFFGHKKGSFTGAHNNKDGLFQAADGGTLFLDEVADLPLLMQVKLLRAIQEKSIRPIGAQQELSVDVRILSATHKNLAELVTEGSFRQDLFYRINVIELHVPSLRERRDDIAMLAEYCLKKISQGMGITKPTLSPAALQALQAYRFPGNVRELENILERALALCEEHIIQPQDLHLPQPENRSDEINENQPLDSYLDHHARDVIEKALKETKYNKTASAKLLGISFRQLRYRLKKLGMD